MLHVAILYKFDSINIRERRCAMFQYPRLHGIFTYIHAQQLPTLSKDVAKHFNISERTLRSDIHNINSILQNHGAKIELKRKFGYTLSIHDETLFQTFLTLLKTWGIEAAELDTAEKRIHYILQVLLYEQDYQSQDKLARLVYVSRNTISNYLKSIKSMLSQHHLQLETKANLGVKVTGKEEYKRSFITDTLIPHDMQSYMVGFSRGEKKLFTGIDLYLIERIVLAFTKQNNFSFSDFNLKNMILHIALLISRIEMGCPIEEHKNVKHMEKFLTISSLLHSIEKAFHIEIPKNEAYYIYSHFISNANNAPDAMNHSTYVQSLVDQLLFNIHENYYFDLRRDMMLVSDLKHHFQSILNTKLYHLNKRNPLLNTIKSNYPLAYEITLTAVNQVFEGEPYQLTEDEIGYVSLHIGAGIERCFNAQIQKKKVIIVCGSGYASSRMLEAKLNNIFKDKITICGRFSYHEYQERTLQDIDFIISTIPIEIKDVPVVIVDFSLYNKDIEHITKTLTFRTDEHNKIDKFFDEQLFIKCHSYISKEALLHDLSTLLLDNAYVQQSFETSVLKREQIAATNMDEVLAIPHPMELCAHKTKVVVAILDEPLLWNKQSYVRIILLLAIKKDEHQDIEHLYDTFIQIMNNLTMRNLLLKCKDFNEFMHILHTQVDDD